MEYDSFEKMIIQDIMNQYPEYTQFLEKQFISSKVIVRKIFSCGFYTEFYVSNKDARILGAPNLMLGKNQWRINDLIRSSPTRKIYIQTRSQTMFEQPNLIGVISCKQFNHMMKNDLLLGNVVYAVSFESHDPYRIRNEVSGPSETNSR